MTTIQAKNYFEHIASIGTVNFYYQKEEINEFLYILVLTSRKNDWSDTENIPLERYADELKDWKIYLQDPIHDVLEQFHQKSTINLCIYYMDRHIIQNENLHEEVEPLTKNFVLIADIFSLQFDENKDFAKLFDSKDKDKVGGCLIPFCGNYSENQRSFAKDLVNKTFNRLAKAWGSEFYKSYTHIELDIPNKTHFFRRLANIAYLKGITEKETMATFEGKSTKFKQPPLDNLR
jgi:hypothetical protein